jgi:hypothetical protein
MASAAALLLLWWPHFQHQPARFSTSPTSSSLGVKGTPAVALYINRQGKVDLWNGQSPIWPGDQLELKVVPDGLTRVQVFTEQPVLGPRKRLIEIYRGPLAPHRTTLLPKAWQVDEQAGAEMLIVVLSQKVISPSTVQKELKSPTKNRSFWLTQLRIPKHLPQEP